MSINWKSKNVRIVLAVIGFILLASLWYALWYRPRKKLKAQEKAIKQAEESLLNVTSILVNELDENEKDLQSNFAPLAEASTQIEISNTQDEIPQGNDEFPLKQNKNSFGPNVVALQLWLQQYQGEDLPVYGANGYYNDETNKAVLRVTNRDNISKKFFVKNRELLAIQNQLMN